MNLFSMFDPEKRRTEGGRIVTQGILFGGGIAGASGVVLAMVELVRANPDKGFALLEKWGPWYFLAIFSLWVFNGISLKVLDVASGIGKDVAASFGRIADEQTRLATAARDQADSMAKRDERDDRDHERMATLVDYSGQQSRQAVEVVSQMQPLLERMANQVDALSRKGE